MRCSLATIERLRTIGLISTLALGLFAGPLPTEAQKAGKVYRIGILRSGSSSSYLYAPQHKILRQGLRELGYTEGKNLLIEYRYAESKLNRRPALVTELVQRKVDVLSRKKGLSSLMPPLHREETDRSDHDHSHS